MYAVNILNGSNVYDLIYDQTKMREYFNCLFWTTKITFPLYKKRNTEKVATHKETSSPWNEPRHLVRSKAKATQNLTRKINLSNCFETKGADSLT